ncbi:MAG: nucleotidyltransferase family protein [Anaerolineales bacterium]|nr:nucleotidyltransferase family protein [Anaerolineales bacterium]
MDAILLAGGIPAPDSPLYPYTEGKNKSTLDIGGKPMLQWVIEALDVSTSIDRIVVVGCEEYQEKFNISKPVVFIPAGGDLISNFQKGADKVIEINPKADAVALVTSDSPLLTPESIDWVINKSLESEDDLYYCVIDQKVMEARFPESGRSYTRLKDINVCGGDLSVVKLSLYTSNYEFWGNLFRARKSSFRMAALIGIDILLLLVFRRLTFNEIVQKITRRLKIEGKGLICPYAELGMDIDKPHQLEFVRREFT